MWNVVINDSKSIEISPRIRIVLANAKTRPRILFTHPSMMAPRSDSISLPMAESASDTPTRMTAKDISLSACSDTLMYFAIHSPTTFANCDESQIPRTIDAIEITWEMKPFLRPWMIAGMRHIKIMISRMFIILLNLVYLRIEIFGAYVPTAKIGKYFYKYDI